VDGGGGGEDCPSLCVPTNPFCVCVRSTRRYPSFWRRRCQSIFSLGLVQALSHTWAHCRALSKHLGPLQDPFHTPGPTAGSFPYTWAHCRAPSIHLGPLQGSFHTPAVGPGVWKGPCSGPRFLSIHLGPLQGPSIQPGPTLGPFPYTWAH
jgi:hypothetical protein